MKRVWEFLVKNWIWLVVVGVVYFLARRDVVIPLLRNKYSVGRGGGAVESRELAVGGKLMAPVSDMTIGLPIYEPQVPPTAGDSRLVIRETNMSLVVNDVSETIGKIENLAKGMGGYMVNSQLSKPEEAANGSITVRVPEEKRAEVLGEIRELGVKVVSENVNGTDVTDEYVDLEARLAVLNKTKVKFEEILDRASGVQDLLSVQRELVSLQSQIDALVGQRKYLEQSAKLTRITVYLSTDELALPYAPDTEWRPMVVFKLAVRSLVLKLRDLGSALIWVVVYAPIWLPLVGVVWWWRKKTPSR